ncbi:transposase, partial [Brucella tritici]|uniref:transposase n=1 Tax=Brucella tritici TaxID=94626 RepID=UPI001F483AAB
MKTSRFSEPQILAILRQAGDGVPVPELCSEHGMSNASFYIYGLLPRCKLDTATFDMTTSNERTQGQKRMICVAFPWVLLRFDRHLVRSVNLSRRRTDIRR